MKQISHPTKEYLLSSLNEQIKENNNDTISNSLKNYSSLYEVKNATKIDSGGFGGESIQSKARGKGKSPGVMEIGFGDTDAMGIGLAAGAYGAGAAAEWLGGLLGQKLGTKAMGMGTDTVMGSLKKKLGVGGAKFIEKLGGQLADIGGKSWFDAQVGNIGQKHMETMAQGGGSETFVIPGRRAEPKYKAEDPNAELRKQVEDEGLKRKARKYGLIP